MALVAIPGTPGNGINIPGDGGNSLFGYPLIKKHGGNDIMTATGDGNTLYGGDQSRAEPRARARAASRRKGAHELGVNRWQT